MRSATHGVVSIWTISVMLAATGCVSFMTETREGPPTQQVEAVDARAIGVPRMSLTSHDDGLGWRVTAETLMERMTEQRRIQRWEGRRYVFSPLSVLPGLIQCPLGLLHLFDDDRTSHILRFGCARLAMFEPLDGVAALPPTVSLSVKTRTDWEPLPHGMIQIMWQGLPEHSVSYALSREGQVDIRLSDLMARLVVADVPIHFVKAPITIQLRYGDGSTIEETLEVRSQQLQQVAREIPQRIGSAQWPVPTIIQIRIDSSTIVPEEALFVRDQLVGTMLQRRMCVVAETLHPYLFDEHRVQYSGIVDESAQVRLGRLLVPSIILLASTGRTKAGTDAGRHIAVQIWDVREGRILATAHGTSRSEAIGHAMHQALTELDLLMAKAPRMGCPH